MEKMLVLKQTNHEEGINGRHTTITYIDSMGNKFAARTTGWVYGETLLDMAKVWRQQATKVVY